jgi:Mg2+-importing ATPase
MNPAQKERIVHALQQRGNVVGFLGDGINDAACLHAAHIGLSVNSAVDVAKESADLILTKNDLSVLETGVIEGRRTYRNIQKYLLMGSSSNFGNMISMACSSFLLPFFAMTPGQILLNNLLYDISQASLPFDHVESSETLKPTHWNVAFIKHFMLSIGAISSIFDLLTFYVLLYLYKADIGLFQTAWFMESIATQVLAVFILRTRVLSLKCPPHPYLIGSALCVISIAWMLPNTPAAPMLGLIKPPASLYTILAGLIISYLLVLNFSKHCFYRLFRSDRQM